MIVAAIVLHGALTEPDAAEFNNRLFFGTFLFVIAVVVAVIAIMVDASAKRRQN